MKCERIKKCKDEVSHVQMSGTSEGDGLIEISSHKLGYSHIKLNIVDAKKVALSILEMVEELE